MNDEAIVELYWKRDESAIGATEEKYGAYLMKIARNILGSHEDSEESVNDTYLAAWNSIPPQKPTVLSLYLAKLTRRIAISLFRQKNSLKRRSSELALSISEMEEILTATETPENELEAKLLSESLNRFLLTLSEEERHTFIGRYFYMDSVKKIAAYCGMSESKAKVMLYRTRQKLKEHLLKEGFEL